MQSITPVQLVLLCSLNCSVDSVVLVSCIPGVLHKQMLIFVRLSWIYLAKASPQKGIFPQPLTRTLSFCVGLAIVSALLTLEVYFDVLEE
jgi:hypothetical protein